MDKRIVNLQIYKFQNQISAIWDLELLARKLNFLQTFSFSITAFVYVYRNELFFYSDICNSPRDIFWINDHCSSSFNKHTKHSYK